MTTRRLVVVPLVVAALLGMSACAQVQHIEQRHFDTRAEAPTSGDLAFVLPDYVPDTATDITVRVGTTDPAAKMYDWAATQFEAPADCQKVSAEDAADPFDPAAWPQAARSGPTLRCGDKPVYLRFVAERVYAW